MKRFSLVAAALVTLCMCGISMAQDCGCAAPACGPVCDACDPCAPKTICTPFNGFFLEMFTRPACGPCAVDACAPCTVAAPACAPAPVCAPAPACGPICAPAPACAPCGDVVCDVKPCAIPCAPFNGFFRNAFAPRIPCGPICDTCAPACEPACAPAPACGPICN